MSLGIYNNISSMSGYHVDTPITIKAEAIPQGRQPSSLIFMSTLYNDS